MACEIERPDPRVLFESIKSMFSSNVLGGAPIIPESNEWYVVSNDYAMAEQFYSMAEQSWRERDPRYACCENLVAMAAQDGFYPRPATFASGYIKLTGVPATLLPSTLEVTIAGQSFVNAGPVPSQIAAQGFSVVRMRALEPGPDGNLPQGTTGGNITTPIVGVDNSITIYGNQFCGGADAEECEAFRTRYIERQRYKPQFSLEFTKEKLMEWPCITGVCERSGTCCYDDEVPDYKGGIACGRPIRLYALFDGIFPFGAAPVEQINEINEWLFGVVQGIGQGQTLWGTTGKIYPHSGAYMSIEIDGMSCVSPATTNEIRARIVEYVARLCPSQILYRRDIEAIISQLTGGTGNYDLYFQSEDLDKIKIDQGCGDAIPECDIRITLKEIRFPNPGE